MNADSVRIQQQTDILLNETTSLGELTLALRTLQSTLLPLAGNDPVLPDQPAPQSVILPHGLALHPRLATSIILDVPRTTKFLRGVKAAIDQSMQKHPDRPVKILYAGPGPLATLVLPLLPLYSAGQIEIDTLEVYADAVRSLRSIIQSLGFEKAFDQILEMDAMAFSNDRGKQYDILLCECMQHALTVEPQVALVHHLSRFLAADGAVIPEEIIVRAALTDASAELTYFRTGWKGWWTSLRRAIAQQRRVLLGPVLTVNRDACRNLPVGSDGRISGPVLYAPPSLGRRRDLVYLTEIRVWDGIVLRESDSTGLTSIYREKSLLDIRPGASIRFDYIIGAQPGFIPTIV